MIELKVTRLHGRPPAGPPASAVFGPAGGSIGRAPTNTLVLDDPDRTVSRTHAQVQWRDGRFVIVDQGSNPLQLNGRALGSGQSAPLADGDRLVIGGFELGVAAQPGSGPMASAVPSVGDEDPFADLLSGLAASPASPASPAGASSASPAPAGPHSPPPLGIPDPFATFEMPGASGDAAPDPFAELLGAAPASPAAAASPLDDFADLGIGAGGPTPSFDALFGTGAAVAPPGADLFAGSPLADPVLQPNTAGALDPLAALQGRPMPSTPPQADHLPIGQFGFTPPAAMPPVPAAPSPQPVRTSAPAAQPAPPASQASDAELLAAFLRGLQGTHQPPQALTPALMERIGVLLRSATEGTLQLLLARQELKREVRAEVTLIAAQANNPLKFSPSADVALAHLLGPDVRGFMPAEAAMRDAYDDLRAHQFGVMVGMRAALAHVIARFEPGELEKKIAARSALDSLFAANRKARLWDQFVALYGGIASEAEDDFHNLFGKAFLAAYEEQMARLKSQG